VAARVRGAGMLRERGHLARWREESATEGRATAGWEETLEAASDARVELLLLREGARHEGYQCPSCGRAAASDGACPLDGSRMERTPDGTDRAVHQVLTPGRSVLMVHAT